MFGRDSRKGFLMKWVRQVRERGSHGIWGSEHQTMNESSLHTVKYPTAVSAPSK